MRTRWILVLTAALVAPVAAAAQLPGVEVVPFAGMYRPMQSLPSVREGGEDVSASLDDGLALGASVEVRFIGPLRVRGNWMHARTELAVGGTQETLRRTPARVNAWVADLVVSGPRLLVARPYLLVGTGYRRYSFDEDRLGTGAAEAFGAGSTDRAGHLGAGVAASAGRFGITIEARNYTSVVRSRQAGASAIGTRQHDLVYAAGVRVRAF